MGTSGGKGSFIPWLQPSRYAWGLVYLVVLAGYVVAGNFDVAYRGLHPRLPIRPGIVKVKTRLRQTGCPHDTWQFHHALSGHDDRGYLARRDDDGALDQRPFP